MTLRDNQFHDQFVERDPIVERDPTGERVIRGESWTRPSLPVRGRGGIGGAITGGRSRPSNLGVPAAPTPTAPRRPVGPLNEQEEQDAILAAAVLDLPYGSEAKAAQIGRVYRQMIAENPWLQDETDLHYRELLQLSDVQRIANTLNSIPGQEFPVTEEFMRAAYEMIQDYQWRLTTHEQAVVGGEAVRRFGVLQIRDQTIPASFEMMLPSLVPEGIEGDTAISREWVGNLLRDEDFSADAHFLAGHLGGHDRGLDMTMVGNRLIWTAMLERGDPKVILDAVIADGTTIETVEEAFLEGLRAWDGKAHTVLSKDNVGGHQTIQGAVLGAVFGFGSEALSRIPFTAFAQDVFAAATGSDDGIVFNTQSDRQRINAEAEEQIRRTVSGTTDGMTKHDAMVAMAQVYMATGMTAWESSQQAWQDGVTDEQFLAFKGDVVADLEEALEASVDRRNSIKRNFDNFMGSAMTLLDAYDTIIHRVAMTPPAILEGLGGEIGLGELGGGLGLPGFKDLEAAWAEVLASDKIGDYGIGGTYSDIPDQWDSYANFAASVIVDPWFWFTPSGKGFWQIYKRHMTTKAGAAEMLKQPAHQQRILKLQEYAQAEFGGIPFLGTSEGIDPQFGHLLVNPKLRAEAASAAGMTDEQFIDNVILRSTAPFEGTYLMPPYGHLVERNGMTVLTNLGAKLGAKETTDTATKKFLASVVATFPRDTTIQLNGAFNTEAHRTILGLFWKPSHAPVGHKVVRDFYKTMSDYLQNGNHLEFQAIRGQIDSLIRLKAQTAAQTDDVVRGFASVKARVTKGEEKLADLEVRLGGLTDYPNAPPIPEVDNLIQEASGQIDRLLDSDDTLKAARDAIGGLRGLDPALRTPQAEHVLNRITRDLRRLPSDPTERAAHIFRLEQSLDELADEMYRAQQIADAGERAVLLREAEEITGGARLADRIKTRLMEIREWRAEIAARADSPQKADILAAFDEQIVAAEAELVRITKNALPMRETDPLYLDLRGKHAAYNDELESIASKMASLRHSLIKAGQPGNRSVLKAFIDRAYYERGELLMKVKGPDGLPIMDYVPGATYPNAPELPLHDWKRITGRDYTGVQSADDGVSLQGAVGVMLSGEDVTKMNDEQALAAMGPEKYQLWKQLEATGYLAQESSMTLPATAQEIAMYEGMANPARWKKKMIDPPTGGEKFVAAAKRTWSAMVLWDYAKMVKSNFDEPIGMGLRDGRWIRPREGIVGLGGPGLFDDEPARGLIEAPLVYGAKSLSRRTSTGMGTRGERYGRSLETPFSQRSSRSQYRKYEPHEAGWVGAARWTINGQFGEDPTIRRVAAALLDGKPDDFLKWWEEEGVVSARAPYWKDNGYAVPVTGELAYRARVNLFDLIASHAPGHETEVRDALIRHAAGAEDIKDEVLKKIDWPMVGPIADGSNRTASDRGFHHLYGGPGTRRGGYIVKDKWSENFEILYTAKKQNGTLYDSAFVADKHGWTREKALQHISAMPESARAQIRASGMWFVDDLDAIAWNYARRYADQMMFTAGAASILGKKLVPLSPFGPATVDFQTRTGMILTDAAVVGWRYGKSAKYVPLYPGAKRALPLNLRVMGEMASIAGATAAQIKDQEGEERPRFTGPLAFIDRWTFYPLGFDRNVIADLYPQLGGPIPGWGISWLPVAADDEDSGWTAAGAWFRDALEFLSPALSYDAEHYGEEGVLNSIPNLEWFTGLVDEWVPSGDTTLRGTVGNGLLGFLALLGGPRRKLAAATGRGLDNTSAAGLFASLVGAYNDWDLFRRPLGWTRVRKNEWANWIENYPLGMLPERGSEDRARFYDETLAATWMKTQNGETVQMVGRFFGGVERPDFDGEHVAQWEGAYDWLPRIHQRGLIGDNSLLNIRALHSRVYGENPTADAAEEYADAMMTLWRELPIDVQDSIIVERRGVAMNAVQGYMAVTDESGEPFNSTYGRRGGRYDLPDGAEGRRVFEDGMDEGWLVRRPDSDLEAAFLGRIAQAYNRTASALWSRTRYIDKEGKPAFILTQWSSPESDTGMMRLAAEKRDQKVVFSDADRDTWANLGIQVTDGMTVLDLARLVKDQKEEWEGFSVPTPAAGNALVLLRGRARTTGNDELAEFAADLKKKLQFYQWRHDENPDAEGEDAEFSDWSAEDQTWAIEQWNYFLEPHREAISQDEYNQIAAPFFGDNRYEAPDFPAWAELPDSAVKASPTRVDVIDGDTITVWVGGEPSRIRLIGVNAAEYNSANSEQQALAERHADRLIAAIRNAETVQIANPDPERFGTSQEYADGGVRLFFVLYLDGKPVWDPGLFSPENPAGRGTQGDGIPEEWWVNDVS